MAEHNFEFKQLNSSKHVFCIKKECIKNGNKPGKRSTMVPCKHSKMASWRCLVCKVYVAAKGIPDRQKWNEEINKKKIFSKPLQ